MGMGNLQRMAQQMQQEMLRIQTELEAATIDGSAGGGVVNATVTGKQELVSVTIDPSVVDAEDVEMLQDLVVAAVNDALRASRELAEQKMAAVTGGLRIPNAVGPVQINVDLRASKVSAAVSVPAPAEGRQLTRVNWLLRQLRDAPADVRADAVTAWSRGDGRSELLGTLRANPGLLVEDAKRDIRNFTLTLTRQAGVKRGQGRGSFVGGVLDLIDTFYGEVVQLLRPWTASAPKIKTPDQSRDEPPAAAADDLAPVPQLPTAGLPGEPVLPTQAGPVDDDAASSLDPPAGATTDNSD